MINQVLHHLPDEPRHRRVLSECARVLRPGGVLVSNTCLHAQTEQGFWSFHLTPRARAAILRRLMPLDALETALSACGIAACGRSAPVDAVVQGATISTRAGRSAQRGGPATRSGRWSTRPSSPKSSGGCGISIGAASLRPTLPNATAMRPQMGQITVLYGIKR